MTCAAPSGNPAQPSDSNGSANVTSVSNGLNSAYENVYNDVDDDCSDDEEFVRADLDSNNGLVSYTKQFVKNSSKFFFVSVFLNLSFCFGLMFKNLLYLRVSE